MLVFASSMYSWAVKYMMFHGQKNNSNYSWKMTKPGLESLTTVPLKWNTTLQVIKSRQLKGCGTYPVVFGPQWTLASKMGALATPL